MNWDTFFRNPIVPGLVVSVLVGRLATAGLPWQGAAGLGVGIAWFGVSLIDWLYNLRRRRAAYAAALERTLTKIQAPLSLVLLLDGPRNGDLKSVQSCVRHALAIDGEPVDFVVEAVSPSVATAKSLRQFLVRLPHGVYGIFLSSRPYIADPERFARETIRDKRLRKAVESHAAWLSVDLVSATPEETEGRHRAYDTIGRLLAAMTGPDCLAIYAPELARCNEFDPALIERLSSGTPLAIFDEPTFEPVLEIEEGDPRMVAAVEEALSRWPEFVAAYHQRRYPDDDRYIVKAEFSESGRSEFMWICVNDIGGGRIGGILMNDPHELEGYHRGMQVSIEMDRLNDWIYPGEEGGIVGGFTLDVLTDRDDS
ncbi:MAG: DUF2314 domain-containing protein [Verrucomicrobiales bacterium]|nr:DUF2314 domain-containing protein [Verrucomicrobiales bacterium]